MLPLAVDGHGVDHGTVIEAAQRLALDFDARQLAADTFGLDALQRRATDEVVVAAQIDHPVVAHANLERVGVVPDVAAEGENGALDAAHVTRADDAQVVRPTGLEHAIPQTNAVGSGVVEIDFVADLATVPGARHDHIHVVQLEIAAIVVGNLQNVLAEQVDHDLLGLRALHLHRRDIDLTDGDIEAGILCQAPAPENDVAVGE